MKRKSIKLSLVFLALILLTITLSGCEIRGSIIISTPNFVVDDVEYNRNTNTAYIRGSFTGSGYVQSVTVNIYENVSGWSRTWFTTTFSVDDIVSRGDRITTHATNVPRPNRVNFSWNAETIIR